MNYRYERIALKDVKFIHELFSFHEYDNIFYEGNTTEDEWNNRFEHINRFEIIYDSDNKIGVINIDKSKNVRILLIAINHELRGMGVGTKIFSDIFKKYGSNIYEVTVKETNVEAIKFYRKLGFKEEGNEIQDLGKNGKHKYLNLTLKR